MPISKTPLVRDWVRDLQIDDKYNYLLRVYAWNLDGNGRPMTNNLKRKDGTRKLEGFGCMVLLHQLIMYLEHGKKSDIKNQVRHLSGDHLDNRLVNLEFGSARDNSQDRDENTGVHQIRSGKWRAKAQLGGKHYYRRVKETREEAQFDYDMMTAMYDYHSILPDSKK